MKLDLHIALLGTFTCGVGYLMVVAGLRKSALELRRRRRLCPSCGRTIDKRICSTCASA